MANTRSPEIGNEPRIQENNTIPEVPPAVDPNRPPTRNDDNDCQCACECTRRKVNDDGGAMDVESTCANYQTNQNSYNSYASSEQGDHMSTSGDEGAENHLIEIGDFGHISKHDILHDLIRHGRFPAIPEDHSPSASGYLSPVSSSMLVETANNEDLSQSMTQSMTSSIMSQLSRGSSAYVFTGEWVHQHGNGFTLVHHPLRLTPDPPFEHHYPIEIDMSESDFEEMLGG